MAIDNITEAFKTDIAHVGDFLTTPGGDLGLISGLSNYKRALFHRLITQPGSLVHRPLYGVGIRSYQNAPSSFAIQQRLATIIQEQFEQDPRTEKVTSVQVVGDDKDAQKTYIRVFVKPIGYSEQEMIFTPFNEANT
jgi:phage baseplate assembly protein W